MVVFLDNLRADLCRHPDASFHVERDGEDRTLVCRDCHGRLSLRYYLCLQSSADRSTSMAEQYVAWTGDDAVPCLFDTAFLRQRAPTTESVARFATLSEAHLLLTLLHAPFAPDPETPTPEGLRFFRRALDAALDRLDTPRETDRLVHAAVDLLKTIVASEADRYFDKLAPAVEAAHRRRTGRSSSHLAFDSFHRKTPLGTGLRQRLWESDVLARLYAPYGLAFDAVHVAALCSLCRDDRDLGHSLALDFLAKFGRGHYDGEFALPAVPHPLESEVRRRLAKRVSPDCNVRVYRFLEACWAGGARLADHLSDAFFRTLWDVKAAIADRVRSENRADLEGIFPRMLFRDYADCYAFEAAVARYGTATRSGRKSLAEVRLEVRGSAPDVLPACRKVYARVRSSLRSVKAFHDGLAEGQLQRQSLDRSDEAFGEEDDVRAEKDCYWTRDLWRHFRDVARGNEEGMAAWRLSRVRSIEPDLTKQSVEREYNSFEPPAGARDGQTFPVVGASEGRRKAYLKAASRKEESGAE